MVQVVGPLLLVELLGLSICNRSNKFGIDKNNVLVTFYIGLSKLSDQLSEKSDFSFNLFDVLKDAMNLLIPILHRKFII